MWAPLDESASWEEVKNFASKVAHEMVADLSDVYVATMTKAKRTGRIFVDFFRNDYTATAIADYAVRARPGAPVATPLDWKELTAIKSADQFNIRDVTKRTKEMRKLPVIKAATSPLSLAGSGRPQAGTLASGVKVFRQKIVRGRIFLK